jgi:hypothetical protein
MLKAENLQEIDGLTELSVQNKITFKWTLKMFDVVDWINLAQGVFHNRALVYKRLNQLFPKEKGQFLTSPAVRVYSF